MFLETIRERSEALRVEKCLIADKLTATREEISALEAARREATATSDEKVESLTATIEGLDEQLRE